MRHRRHGQVVVLRAMLALCLAGAPGFAALGESDERLPPSWHRLPENMLGAPLPAVESYEAPSKKAEASVESTLRATSHALDRLATTSHARPTPEEEWRLSGLSVGLTLSASGLLGIMVASGDASASVFWRRSAPAPARFACESPGDAPTALLNAGMSPAQIALALEPAFRVIEASGRVANPAAAKKELTDIGSRYQKLVAELGDFGGPFWRVAGLRLGFSIDGSGKVNPATSVGGSLQISIEWAADGARQPVLSTEDSAIRRLLAAIGQELGNVADGEDGPEDFRLTRARVGVGFFGSGNLGVMKAGGSISGGVLFEKRPHAHPIAPDPASLATEIPLVDDGIDEARIALARESGVRVSRERGVAVYHLPRKAFRAGLKKAHRIGTFLTSRAVRGQGARWEISQVTAGFSLSLSGTTGLVTLGGNASLDLTYGRGCGR